MSNRFTTFLARGGVWTVVQFVLLTSVIVLGYQFHADWPRAVTIGGWLLLAVGGAIFLAGSLVLGRNLSPYTQPRPDAQLVRRGIYQHLRHPLYTGVMCAAIGWALGHTSPVALGAALTLIPFFNAKARAEERWLMKRFPDYADYVRRVPRFLPRRRRKANLVCNF